MKAMDIFAFGNSSSIAGAAVLFNGGVNCLISKVLTLYWAQGVSLQPITGGITQQGILMSDINIVACTTGILMTPVSGSSADWISIVNFQIDQGAVSPTYGIHLQGGANGGLIMGGLILQNGGTCGLFLDNTSQYNVSNVFILNTGTAPTDALHLSSGSSNCMVDKCSFGGATVLLDSGANTNYINNTGSSTVTNNGTGNHTITTPF
jgi:hypothetical protein